jgi:hypothetical protein
MGDVIAETAGGGATGTTREYIYLYEAEIAPTMGSRPVWLCTPKDTQRSSLPIVVI